MMYAAVLEPKQSALAPICRCDDEDARKKSRKDSESFPGLLLFCSGLLLLVT